MISAKPLPDEFMSGHVGRLACINGFHTIERTITTLSSDREGRSPLLDPLEIYQSVAALCDLPTNEYLSRNTLLPIDFFCADRDSEVNSYEHRRIYRQRTTLMRLRAPARFCAKCIQCDMAAFGFSYWHRSHLIYGVEWCLHHGEPLYQVMHSHPYERTPAQWLELGNDFLSLRDSPPDHPVIRAYANIASTILQEARRSTRARVAVLLSQRTRAAGIHVSFRKHGFQLSDEIRRRLPAEWLATYFPKIAEGPPGKFCPAVDAAVFETRCSEYCIVLALAALDLTAQNALTALTDASAPADKREARMQAIERALLPAYIAGHGSYREAAKVAGKCESYLHPFFRKAGLPPLGRADSETRDAVLSFLREATSDEIAAWQARVAIVLSSIRQPSNAWLRQNILP